MVRQRNATRKDGGTGADELHGLVGNDVLVGGLGNDFLSGEEGDDIEEGGAGDVLRERGHLDLQPFLSRIFDHGFQTSGDVVTQPFGATLGTYGCRNLADHHHAEREVDGERRGPGLF